MKLDISNDGNVPPVIGPIVEISPEDHNKLVKFLINKHVQTHIEKFKMRVSSIGTNEINLISFSYFKEKPNQEEKIKVDYNYVGDKNIFSILINKKNKWTYRCKLKNLENKREENETKNYEEKYLDNDNLTKTNKEHDSNDDSHESMDDDKHNNDDANRDFDDKHNNDDANRDFDDDDSDDDDSDAGNSDAGNSDDNDHKESSLKKTI